MENQVTVVEVTDIDFNGDGWHIKVGQFYSSPYSESHIKIIRIELAEDKDPNSAKVYFQCVNPRNYDEFVSEHIDFHRAWHINDGTWDLERDVNLPTKERGLIVKYDVRKVDTGELVNNCFVLRPDKDGAAVHAMLAYAEATQNRALAADIHSWLNTAEKKRPNVRNLLAALQKDPDKFEALLEIFYHQYMDEDGGCFMEARQASRFLSGIGQAIVMGSIEDGVDELGVDAAVQKVTVDHKKNWWTPEQAEDQNVCIAHQI